MSVRTKNIIVIILTLLCLGFSGCKEYGKVRVYDVPVELEGGSGRASVESPVRVSVSDNGISARLKWSSSHYDYMIVDGEKYYPLEGEGAEEGHSVFDIPLKAMDDEIRVIGDTTAMSVPHEIEYTLKFDWSVIEGSSKDKSGVSDTADAADNGMEDDSIYRIKGIQVSVSDSGTLIPLNITDKNGKAIEFDTEVIPEYARMFTIAQSDEGFSFIHIEGSGDFLILPEGIKTGDVAVTDLQRDVMSDDNAENDPIDVVVLCKPITNIYLVSSSAMDIFASLDEELPDLGFSSLDKKDWRVDAAIRALDNGTLKYAGKYSAPDYELLLSGNCSLAVENTMVYHKPEVIEKLNGLGIPVLVEVSSYEPHPLGRIEWIKLYGVLTGREDEASEIFKEKLKEVEPILKRSEISETDYLPTVAFFYVTSTGAVNVRKSNDYISRMIKAAGGEYIPDTGTDDEENALSTVNMQMEAFYAKAVNADILIYNGTVGGGIGSIKELTDKDKLFEDFKAVKNSSVYSTDDNLYQKTMSIPELILDLDKILQSSDVSDDDLVFLNKVK